MLHYTSMRSYKFVFQQQTIAMLIKQFENSPLAHFSYTIIDGGKMEIIDPERDPKQVLIKTILDGQSFIPAYFGYNVGNNKKAADRLATDVDNISFSQNGTVTGLIIDTQIQVAFKEGHLEGNFNSQVDSAEFKN